MNLNTDKEVTRNRKIFSLPVTADIMKSFE